MLLVCGDWPRYQLWIYRLNQQAVATSATDIRDRAKIIVIWICDLDIRVPAIKYKENWSPRGRLSGDFLPA